MFAFPVCLRFLRIVDLLFSFCCFLACRTWRISEFTLSFQVLFWDDVLLGWVSEQKDSGASRNTSRR